jgi:hypothetical protein
VYDISNPIQPVNVANTNNGGNPFDVAVAGNQLFLVNMAGLRIYDISNPTNIFSVGYTNVSSGAQSVAVSGNHAFVASSSDGLHIYDISNPASIVQIGQTNFPGYQVVTVSDNLAYVLGTAFGLSIYDVSDPTSPKRIGVAGGATSPYDFHGLVQSGRFVFAAMKNGLHVFDTFNPTNPVQVAWTNIPTVYGSSGIALLGPFICLANQDDGFRILQLTGPKLDISTSNSSAVISWPSNSLALRLQQTSTPGGMNWQDVTNSTVTATNRTRVSIGASGQPTFFRLTYP